MHDSAQISPSIWFARSILTVILWFAISAAAFDVPRFDPNVVDTAGVISAEGKQELNTTIQRLRNEANVWAAILVVPTTGDDSIESAAEEAFRNWELGKTGSDNGLLILVAVNDRRVRIEVGYGLEGAIPDVLANRIIQDTLVPAFKRQEYVPGLTRALLIASDLVKTGESVELTADSTAVEADGVMDDFASEDQLGIGTRIAIWVFMIVMVPMLLRAAALWRASGYEEELRPTTGERTWWRVVSPSKMSLFLTGFMLINPGIFFLLFPGWLGLAFIAFAYVFLITVNTGYLAMLRPKWRKKYRTSNGTGPAREAFENNWRSRGSGSSGSGFSRSSSSSSSRSSSGGGRSGGGGASGSW